MSERAISPPSRTTRVPTRTTESHSGSDWVASVERCSRPAGVRQKPQLPRRSPLPAAGNAASWRHSCGATKTAIRLKGERVHCSATWCWTRAHPESTQIHRRFTVGSPWVHRGFTVGSLWRQPGSRAGAAPGTCPEGRARSLPARPRRRRSQDARGARGAGSATVCWPPRGAP